MKSTLDILFKGCKGPGTLVELNSLEVHPVAHALLSDVKLQGDLKESTLRGTATIVHAKSTTQNATRTNFVAVLCTMGKWPTSPLEVPQRREVMLESCTP